MFLSTTMKLLLLVILVQYVTADRLIRFIANKRITRSLPLKEYDAFQAWFSAQETLDLVKLNPGIISVEEQQGESSGPDYLASLTPINFPGLKLSSSVLFAISRDSPSSRVTVRCNAGSLKQTFEGNPFFANLVSKLTPTVISKTSFGLEAAEQSLVTDAELVIQFNISPWFPVSGDLLEQGGSAAIGTGMEKDLGVFLDKILAIFASSPILTESGGR